MFHSPFRQFWLTCLSPETSDSGYSLNVQTHSTIFSTFLYFRAPIKDQFNDWVQTGDGPPHAICIRHTDIVNDPNPVWGVTTGTPGLYQSVCCYAPYNGETPGPSESPTATPTSGLFLRILFVISVDFSFLSKSHSESPTSTPTKSPSGSPTARPTSISF